jgi:hypothetical protein
VLAPWVKLQAVLQGMLQAAGPVDCYYKVLTGRVVERKFKACWPSFIGVLFLDPCFRCFLDVLILVPRRFLKRFIPGFSFLAFGSWALLVVVLEILD